MNRHKEEAAQLIKEKEELQARVSRVNDLLKLVSSTLGQEKDSASSISVAFVFWQVQMIRRKNVIGSKCRLLMYTSSETFVSMIVV